MANTGNLYPGTGENITGRGDQAWSNPGNVVSDNATDATCASTGGTGSEYLVARNFTIPAAMQANALIGGITVRVEASEHSTGNETLYAQLQDASGALMGDSPKQATVSGTPKSVYTFGGTTDSWGLGAALLNAGVMRDADFGVRLWFETSHDIRIDYVTLAAEYSSPPPGIATTGDTALALTRTKIRAVGLASSTETALACTVSKLKVIAVGVATSTSVAFVPNYGIRFASYTDFESDDAPFPGGESWQGGASICKAVYPGGEETDTALAPVVEKVGGGADIIATGTATETDTALGLTAVKRADAGMASESDAAVLLSLLKQRATGMASESDTALGLALEKLLAVALAAESDAALAPLVAAMSGHVVPIGVAAEINIALALAAYKRLAVGTAEEMDAAFTQSRIPNISYRTPTWVGSSPLPARSVGAGELPVRWVKEETD